MEFTIGKNNEIPLPDDICEQLGIENGDILKCEAIQNSGSLTLIKHDNQSLTDEEITDSGNLTRVIPYDS